MNSPDIERQQFEAWAGTLGSWVPTVKKDTNGRYQSLTTASAWSAWQARAALSTPPQPTERSAELSDDDVQWLTNDNAELGVKIGNQFFFLYKGHSLVYKEAKHDDGTPMHWRPVFKREFGECAHPVNYDDPTLIGKVSLDDSDEWQELPADAPKSERSAELEALLAVKEHAEFDAARRDPSVLRGQLLTILDICNTAIAAAPQKGEA